MGIIIQTFSYPGDKEEQVQKDNRTYEKTKKV